MLVGRGDSSRLIKRGRYPRPPVSVDEHTIELAGSPVFYRSAGPAHQSLYPPRRPHELGHLAAVLGADAAGSPRSASASGGRARAATSITRSMAMRGSSSSCSTQLGLEPCQPGGARLGCGGRAAVRPAPPRARRAVRPDQRCARLPGLHVAAARSCLARTRLGELIMGSARPSGCSGARSARAARGRAEQLDALWDQFDQGTQRAILRLSSQLESPTDGREPGEHRAPSADPLGRK